ncbi:ABC transporter substrate-binding protein [Saliphagus sp. GCM10025334]
MTSPPRRAVLAAVGAGSLTALAGCLNDVREFVPSSDGQSQDETDRTIKLGVMQPLTGDLEAVGKPIRDAAILPADQVADAVDMGVDYSVVDTAADQVTGVQRAVELVEAGYPMVNGPAASDVTLQATQQVLIPYRTVCCSPASTTPTITSLNDGGLVFRTALSDSLQAVILAERAASDLGHDSAAVLYVNNDYGWQLSQAFTQAFETEHDGTVTNRVPFEPLEDEGDDRSYEDELESAQADDPDLLVLIGYPLTGARILTDFYDAGGEEDVLVTEGMRDPTLHEAVDHSLDGIRGTAPLSAGPYADEFADLFTDAYDADPGIFTAHAYDASAALLLANAYAGQNDGTAIRSAMYAVTSESGTTVTPASLADGLERAAAGDPVEYQGASSSVVFDTNGDTVDATFEYWEFDESADGGIASLDEVSLE